MIIDKIKRELDNRVSSFRVKGEISGALWAEISITDNTRSPIWLGTKLEDTKFSAQSLSSYAIISEGSYRIDNNSHRLDLHQHIHGMVCPAIEVKTFKDALLRLLGSEYWKLEEGKRK